MKALILSIEGRKAIVLLRGGEMRTVHAHKDWSVGQEIDLHQAAAWKPSAGGAAHILVPLAACAAVMVLLFAGIYRLGGHTPDPIFQPLSSGSVVQETSAAPDMTPDPEHIPADETPEAAQTPLPEITKAPEPDMTKSPQATSRPDPDEICDECGERGHDDDDCPHQICDECGRRGHDDDDCPYQVCDECGAVGHDDDDCPQGSDDDDDDD